MFSIIRRRMTHAMYVVKRRRLGYFDLEASDANIGQKGR